MKSQHFIQSHRNSRVPLASCIVFLFFFLHISDCSFVIKVADDISFSASDFSTPLQYSDDVNDKSPFLLYSYIPRGEGDECFKATSFDDTHR